LPRDVDRALYHPGMRERAVAYEPASGAPTQAQSVVSQCKGALHTTLSEQASGTQAHEASSRCVPDLHTMLSGQVSGTQSQASGSQTSGDLHTTFTGQSPASTAPPGGLEQALSTSIEAAQIIALWIGFMAGSFRRSADGSGENSRGVEWADGYRIRDYPDLRVECHLSVGAA